MQFLPIVERELRVAARHSRTWWRRVLTLIAGLAILAFVWLTFGRAFGFNRVGGTVFIALGGFGLVYALLAGPLATADSISRERREGTLGLLFLTHLRSYDVVLGKVAASSLDVLLGLLAALPLLAMPLLAGGVSLAQLASMGLALVNLLLLSLATGVFASSLFTSGRAALALTLAILLSLTIGLPMLGEGVLHLSSNGWAAGMFYMACPSWTIMLCLNPTVASASFKYWLNMGGTHALAWIFLGAACLRTGKAWRDLPESKFWRWCLGRVERWSKGNPVERLSRRRSAVQQNPIAWLEGSSRAQEKLLAVLICGWAIFSALKHLHSMNWPQPWPQRGFVIVWAMFAHYILLLWLAVQAPRRFADDKQSGALEVLLCTTLPVSQIVRGIMSALFRRFGVPLLALVALDLFHLHLFVSTRGGWANSNEEDLMLLSGCGVVVFLLQGYTFARVGLYQGLSKANSVRATLGLIWSLGLMPWFLCIGSFLILDLARSRFRFLPNLDNNGATLGWALAHLVVFAAFLARASWQLGNNFRLLAATTPVSWPKRWWARVESASQPVIQVSHN